MTITASLTIRYIALFQLIILGFPLHAHQTDAHKNKHTVLVLHSYHQGFKWTDNVHYGIIDELKNYDNYNQLEIYTEYLDSKRNQTKTLNPELLSYFKQKFKNIPVDVIITSDDDAFNFALMAQDSLFGGTPLVFCGVNNYAALNNSIETKKDNYTGVVEGFNLPGTIETALKLTPEANRLLIINDSTVTGLANKALFDKIKNQLPQHITYQFCRLFDMDSVKSELAKYEDNTAILLLSYNSDKKGKYFNYVESGQLICNATSLPVFVVWDFYLGTGVIGGLVVSGVNQGNTAAHLALKILEGTPVDSIPVITQSPNQYMFDYQQLKNRQIQTGLIPKGSIIINKPISVFFKYRNELIGFISVTLFMAISIVILIIINRKKTNAEQNLLRSRNKLSTILETAVEGFIEFDIHGNTFNVNREFCNILEVSKRDIIVENIGSLARFSSNPNAVMAAYRECINGNSISIELQVLTKNSHTKHVILNCTPLFGIDNEVTGGFATLFDITELKTNAAELLIAKNKAEQSDRLKTAFLANMSHEIRTPMNAILGFSSLLKDDELKKEQRENYISIIQLSSNNLMNLINDILDLSIIDAGHVEIKRQAFNLNEHLGEIEKMFLNAPELNTNSIIALKLKAPEQQIVLYSDKFRIHQILVNLINNALKFTEEGLVEFGFTINQNSIQFFVTDTGIGIVESIKPLIFERFNKIDNDKNRFFRGTGLGLPISKSLVELLGGKIWFEPNNPKGTKFLFTVSGTIEILPD